MAHRTQASVLSHLHLRQAEEIRAQSRENQKQVSASVAQKAQPPRSRLSELQQEAFQYLLAQLMSDVEPEFNIYLG